MTQIILVCLAAAANVILNVSLKRLVHQMEAPSIGDTLLRALGSPWLWVAGASGLTLVGLFMAAIRSGSVSVAYIGVTSLAMVGLTIASAFLYQDIPGTVRIVGLGFVVVGLVLTLAG